MSWVKEVTTNIKSPDGGTRTHEIGKHTLLFGPNESGKSAIAEAVQLALTGSASGMLYRNKPIKSGAQLSFLRPEGTEVVFSQVKLEDGQAAAWVLEEGKRPKRTGVQGFALPIDDLRSIMSGSDSKIREFFYENILGETDRSDVQAHLPESLWDAFDAYTSDEEKVNLTELITSLGKRKRELRAQGSAAQKMLETLNPTRVPDAQIEALWDQLGEAQRLSNLKELYRTHRNQADSKMIEKIRASLTAFGPKERIRNLPTPEEAKENLEEAYSTRGEFRSALSMKRIIETSETEAQEAGKLEKALLDSVGKLLTERNVWGGFRSKVNLFLPNKDRFEVIDNGSLTMGLIRANGIHVALSGSTEARTLAAMAAALVVSRRGQSQKEEDYPALIVVDDRMWDTKTLSVTMKALEKIDCQVIIMSTVKPRGKQRDAWTYVNLGEG